MFVLRSDFVTEYEIKLFDKYKEILFSDKKEEPYALLSYDIISDGREICEENNFVVF